MKTINNLSLVDSTRRKISILHDQLVTKHGIYSSIYMNAGGFRYIGRGDTVYCGQCELEVSDWTTDMNPFKVHAQRNPTCPFVQSILQAGKRTTTFQVSTIDERPAKRLKTESTQNTYSTCNFLETESLKQARKRTFSHWPRHIKPTADQLIEAGFFRCNGGDRVICIYCNKIIQGWTPDTDPYNVHKTLSPNCVYVTKIPTNSEQLILPVINELTKEVIPCDQLVTSEVAHVAYKEIPKRYASFSAWTTENVPSVDDLVRAGFFYTGTRTIVTCFYCNGSLQNWGANDNPTIEHARWFPRCAYIRQLCGDELFQRIQRHKELKNRSNEQVKHLQIPNKEALRRYVYSRLDLPMSQRMLALNFKLSIVQRCWEDQFNLKHDDFVNETDLFIACTVLQKQIEHINGQKENINIATEVMNQTIKKESLPSSKPILTEMANTHKNEEIPSPTNPCALCLTEERCLAFIPCGHLASCVPCGHSLKSCPICRSQIKATVRIYA